MKDKRKVIEIKGGKNGLVIIMGKDSTLKEIEDELEVKLKEGGSFFDQARIRIDLCGRQGRPEEIEEIKKILVKHNLIFDGITSNNEHIVVNSKSESLKTSSDQKETRALIVQRTLRSGQKIHYKGAVVIFGDVNPGAEIIAGGDIIVMGKLRGMAHAGAFGDLNTSVTAWSLNPTQLRIGDILSRSPDTKEEHLPGSERASVQGGRIVVSPLFNNE